MPFYAVIDTNVLVSALLSNHSDSSTVIIIEKVIKGEIVPVFSKEIMDEYYEVLHRQKYKFNPDLIDSFLSIFTIFGFILDPKPSGETLPDMKDLPFYEVAMEKSKENKTFLVTGNKKHFPIKPFIVTPKEMLDIIAQNQKIAKN